MSSGSRLRTVAEVDREGVRIALAAKAAYDLFLSRTLRHAQLVRAPDPEAAFDLLVAGKADVLAGRFMAIGQALGMPKGRDAGAEYLREFIEDVKASGLVARAIEKAGIRGVTVAP